jgi:uncharacterized Ntn-hydrolase superfamily protein
LQACGGQRMPEPMTWSIVARDAATGAFGVAVASKVLAVGALCPWLEAGAGALSSQSFTNPLYGPDVLSALRGGASVEQAIQWVTGEDAGRGWRQVHGVDHHGDGFAYTGEDCVDWNGHLVGDGVSVAGNMLAGPAVVADAMAAWQKASDVPFSRRLMQALAAGEAAGGDKRGKQSAAIKVVGQEPWPWIDLRVDDSGEPVQELERLLGVFLTERAPYYATLASRAEPAGVYNDHAREARRRGYLRAHGLKDE